MIIDSHAHLQDAKFGRDLERVLERASVAGVERILCFGDSLDSSRKALALAHRNEKILCGVGIHPHNAKTADAATLEAIRGLASNPKVAAIGEIGLDYFYRHSEPAEQIAAFEAQIELARELDLPMCIHCREAFDDLLEILERREAGRIGGAIHCFGGSVEQARRLVEMGFYIGIAGPATYDNADTLREVAQAVPLERLLIESDSPYLAPLAKRGRRNEPAYIKHTAKAIAALRGLAPQQVARATKMNAARVYGLPLDIAPSIAYSLKRTLYLNLTNQCTNRCFFCYRAREHEFAGYNLRLSGEPDREQILERLQGADRFEEVVFCGIGEPTFRLDLICELAAWLKENTSAKIRLNTNGQGSLICGEDIAPKLAGKFDAVSISLNAPDAESYNRICHPSDPDKAYASILDFARRVKQTVPEVYFTIVAAPSVDVEACRTLAEETLKIPLRVREYTPTPPSEAAGE
ncbi:MAG: putative deoxyribonuclease YcfH [candidate division BRC1 bacterium ADurb.BinA364]|nr:MAG: putative deoxyribonuclease YcfH [candidate division BRC1 bacterium ADurb.BinA364]